MSVFVDGDFMGEGVLLPLKPNEITLLSYAKEVRVTVTKGAETQTHPPHMVDFIDS